MLRANPDKIKISRIKPAAIRAKPRIWEPSFSGRDGASTRYLSSWPVLTSRSYSIACSRLNFSSGIEPVNIRMSSGKFSGRQWLLKKCTVNRKPAARTASSPWKMVATLKTHPGRIDAVKVLNHSIAPLTPMMVTPQNGAQ